MKSHDRFPLPSLAGERRFVRRIRDFDINVLHVPAGAAQPAGEKHDGRAGTGCLLSPFDAAAHQLN
jgi:hypothetical protein